MSPPVGDYKVCVRLVHTLPGLQLSGLREAGITQLPQSFHPEHEYGGETDSDFNPYHRLNLANSPPLFNNSAPLTVHFSHIMGRSDKLVLGSGPLGYPATLRTRFPNHGTGELDWFWTIGEISTARVAGSNLAGRIECLFPTAFFRLCR